MSGEATGMTQMTDRARTLSSPDEIDIAKSAWAAGDYDEVLSRIGNRRDPQSKLLLARTYLRLHQSQPALDVLRKFASPNPQEEVFASILRASAEDRLGVLKDEPQYPVLPPRASAELRGALAFYSGLSLWMHGKHEEAYVRAQDAIETGTPEYLGLALELQGWVKNGRNELVAAAERFYSVIDFLEASGHKDDHLRLGAVVALGLITAEKLQLELLPRLTAEAAKLGPPLNRLPGFVFMDVHIATAYILRGDATGAYSKLLEARRIAMSPAVCAFVDIELASFHRRDGSNRAAERHLTMAEESIKRVDWTAQALEMRNILLAYANEAAALGSNTAGRMYTKALSLTGKRDPMIAFEHSSDAQAWALAARGQIALGRGRQAEGADDLRRAISIWESSGFRYRAALATIELARICPRDPAVAALRAFRREFPRSWIAHEAKELEAKQASPFAHVTTAEKRVLEKICEGKTSRQIAAELARSPSTVRNQTISLYRRLGVNTRSGLVALAARDGSFG